MSQKIDAFYFDDHGNFRGVLHKLSSFSVPKDQIYYDPKSGDKGQLVVGDQRYDVGDPFWPQETDLILKLEKK